MVYGEQWEYRIIDAKASTVNKNTVEGDFNSLGFKGWELVSVAGRGTQYAYFKRKKS